MQRKRLNLYLFYFFLSVVMLLFVSPYIWLIIQSFQTNAELADVPPRLKPHEDPFVNYKILLFYKLPEKDSLLGWETAVPPFARFIPRGILNSFIVAVGTTVLTLLLSCAPAYTFARLKFRFRDQIMFLMLGLRMFPVIIVIVPLFVIISAVGLTDNVFTLILLYSGFMVPYSNWILATYFQTIPLEIEQSAIIDGCNRLQVIGHVVIPLAKPGLVATGLFIGIVSWNEFLLAVTVTQTEASYTLPVIVSMFTQQLQMTPFDLMITAGVIGTIIPVAMVMFFERHIVSGLTMGALKS